MKKNLTILIFLLLILVVSEKAKAQYTYDSVFFETPTSKIIIDTTGNNIWQIGTPGKNFFDTAYSGAKAILTDTVNSYPANDTSSFIYVIKNPYTQTCQTSMEFWHKYDTDTLTDIGIIEASYDGGNSWININDTTIVSSNNLGNSYFRWDNDYHKSSGTNTTHALITSGKSDGWILSRIIWRWWIPVKSDTIIINPDSLMIRFTFISDSIETNKEGWMIDNILTASAVWQLCTGIESQPEKENISISPNPFSSQTILKSDFPLNNSKIVIYNSFGQVVNQTKVISGQKVILYRNNLPPGLYFLVLSKNNKSLITRKLVIVN
jgi:hypothetical protein